MILMAVAEGPAHGYEIKKRAEARSGGAIRLDAGSLYRTVSQLVDRKFLQEVKDRPEPNSDDSRRRYYEITELGRAVLRAEVDRLANMVDLVRTAELLQGTGGSS